MKSIMMSIKPKYVAKILNGEKTIEIRKRFPKDYRGWVYIYCTKKEYLYRTNKGYFSSKKPLQVGKGTEYTYAYSDEGKVVARFYCDKVEEIMFYDKEVQRKACLTEDELFDYLFVNEPYHEDMKNGYGIHISQLEIFDKPRELSEFKLFNNGMPQYRFTKNSCEYRTLTKAPQSWCYIEEEK